MSDETPHHRHRPLTEAHTPSDIMTAVLDAERNKIADDRLTIAKERIELADAKREADTRQKPSWIAEWLKPNAILPLTFFAIAAFATYSHDQAATASSMKDLAGSVATIATRLDHDEQGTADRVKDLVPLIRSAEVARTQNDLINKEQGDRIESIAQSVLQMRQAMDALRDAVTKTHEELMIEEARNQREGRLTSPHGSHALTPAENDAAAK